MYGNPGSLKTPSKKKFSNWQMGGKGKRERRKSGVNKEGNGKRRVRKPKLSMDPKHRVMPLQRTRVAVLSF